MRVLMSLFVTLSALAQVGRAQERDGPPGQPPCLWLASASQREGKVVVQIAEPQERGGKYLPGGLERGPRWVPLVMTWSNIPKVTLGKTLHVCHVDGKPAAPSAVLKALAKPKGVAVFVRTKGSDPIRPDPFYLALLRADTLILVVNAKDIYPEVP
jgi:hypothetical protein